MLIAMWISDCTEAVAHLLEISSLIPFLTGQIGSNEHDEMERLGWFRTLAITVKSFSCGPVSSGQGLCAYVLGLCLVSNDNKNAHHNQEQLFQLIEKRIGREVFVDKLSEVSKHEAYNKARLLLVFPVDGSHQLSTLNLYVGLEASPNQKSGPERSCL